jgi:hypothetical protein
MRAGYILSVRKESTSKKTESAIPCHQCQLRHGRLFSDLVSFDFYCVLFAGTGVADLGGEKTRRDMGTQSRPEDTIAIEELCQVTIVDLAIQNVALGPWLLKFIGTLLPITLGFLLGVLATAL